jgi:hypothetical protein
MMFGWGSEPVAGSGFGSRAGVAAPAVPEAPRDDYQERWNVGDEQRPAAPEVPRDDYQERWNEGDERPPTGP